MSDGLTNVGGREALLVEYISVAGEKERERVLMVIFLLLQMRDDADFPYMHKKQTQRRRAMRHKI